MAACASRSIIEELKKLGIDTIVDLRGERHDLMEKERAHAESLGMRLVHSPGTGWTAPRDEQIAQFFALVSETPRRGPPAVDRRTPKKLEVGAEFAEGWEDDEFAGAGHDWFVFHVPGVLVGNVDGVEADFHGGVDVAARAVADHPALALDDFMFVDEARVGDGVFFGNDFDGFEKALQAGALHFCGLFGGFAFGEENQAVTFGKVGESFRDAIENLWRSAFEFDDAGVDFREGFAFGHLVGKFQVRFFEGAAEAAHSVAVLTDIFAFGFVEDVANVGAGVAAGFDQSDEIFDELFKEDVIFPEGVVGVDHQGVASHLAVCPISEFLRLSHKISV